MRGHFVQGSGTCRCYGKYLYALWTWALAPVYGWRAGNARTMRIAQGA